MSAPGQSVESASRWPLTTRNDTLLPAAKRLLPPETIVACPSGSTCATSSRHAIRLVSASRAASVSGAQRAVSDHGDADAAGVEALRVRPDDRAVDAARTALVDAPVGVDEEVVANVVPAVRAHVVGVDRADDGRHVACRIAVRRVRVVHEDHVHRVGVARRRAPQRLVCAPAGARDDRRLTGNAQPGCAGGRRDCDPRPRARRGRVAAPRTRTCTSRLPGSQTGSAWLTGPPPSASSLAQRDHGPTAARVRTSTTAPGRAAQRAPTRSKPNGARCGGSTCRPRAAGARQRGARRSACAQPLRRRPPARTAGAPPRPAASA